MAVAHGANDRVRIPILRGEDDHPLVITTAFGTSPVLDLAITEVDWHHRTVLLSPEYSVIPPIPMVPECDTLPALRGYPP
jgi:hypothetical protein